MLSHKHRRAGIKPPVPAVYRHANKPSTEHTYSILPRKVYYSPILTTRNALLQRLRFSYDTLSISFAIDRLHRLTADDNTAYFCTGAHYSIRDMREAGFTDEPIWLHTWARYINMTGMHISKTDYCDGHFAIEMLSPLSMTILTRRKGLWLLRVLFSLNIRQPRLETSLRLFLERLPTSLIRIARNTYSLLLLKYVIVEYFADLLTILICIYWLEPMLTRFRVTRLPYSWPDTQPGQKIKYLRRLPLCYYHWQYWFILTFQITTEAPLRLYTRWLISHYLIGTTICNLFARVLNA
jgi:hypothetical protein